LGIDLSPYSPAVLQKIVYAGTQEHSFAEGSRSLLELGDLEVSRKEVERVTKRIGSERLAEARSETETYEALPLVQKLSSPRLQVPQIAAVGGDGGRYLRIPSADGQQGSSDDSKSNWREFKAGCLLSLAGEQFDHDPCPEVPESLLDLACAGKLAREIKSAGTPEKGRTFGSPSDSPTDEEDASAGPSGAECESRGARPGAPTVLVRSVVACSADNQQFGAQLAAAAWARGFMGAPRKAFLGDGAAGNWTLQKRFFPGWTPILDFIHLLTYIYTAAMAARSAAAGRLCYLRWITLAWQGRVDELLAELSARSAELGAPPEDASASDPRKIVHDALRYVANNRERMRYDEYRRLGLPLTTSHIESTVKQLNRRIKGTEKHWSRPGGDALLQLKADYLSETRPMDAFWIRRQEQATGFRCYSRAL
jgi:hypothetical protein